MVKCPDCLKELTEPNKKWKYGKFNVEAYSCECGTDLRTYRLDGEPSFALKKTKTDKNWKKTPLKSTKT